MPDLIKRVVTSSFIFKFPDDDETKTPPQVALFQRSNKVRTYQHKYAPISGTVEETDASPLHTAWREIKEETRLVPPDIRLFRHGKPYTFVDEAIGRQWTIHPFGFILQCRRGRESAAITLDWEHDAYAWFDPRDVSDDESFGGVPRLRESLRRVWFDLDIGEAAGQVLQLGLRALQEDHSSGARVLANQALGYFSDVVVRLGEEVPPSAISGLDRCRDVWWRHVRVAAWHLWKNGRESMGASVLSVLLDSLAMIERRISHQTDSRVLSTSLIAQEAGRDIQEYAKQRLELPSKVTDHFLRFIASHFPTATDTLTLLTLSSSSTITSCLTSLITHPQRPSLDIRILESRPLFEGVTTARHLQHSSSSQQDTPNVSISIHTDASAALAARNVDLVLIGADMIDRTANVSNKTGSLPAILAARHVSPGCKVAVVSELEKVSPFAAPGPEENEAEEVSAAWGVAAGDLSVGDNGGDFAVAAGVEVKNVYFEWVGAELIDEYVTEEGLLSSQDIAKVAESVMQKADRFFAEL